MKINMKNFTIFIFLIISVLWPACSKKDEIKVPVSDERAAGVVDKDLLFASIKPITGIYYFGLRSRCLELKVDKDNPIAEIRAYRDWVDHGMSEPVATVAARLRRLFKLMFCVERGAS